MKKVVVFGSSGFVGSHLIKKIKETEENTLIYGIDNQLPLWNYGHADKFYIVDLRDVRNIVRKNYFKENDFDEIYQCAGNSGNVKYYQENPNKLIENTIINKNILEAFLHFNFKGKIFYPSSINVYSVNNNEIKIDNNTFFNENGDSNGLSDILIENLYFEYYKKYKFSIRIGRLSNVFGPKSMWVGPHINLINNWFLKLLIAKKHKIDYINLWGDGDEDRTFIYIDDAINGILKLTASNIISPFNIVNEKTIRLYELIKILMDIVNYYPTIIRDFKQNGSLKKEAINLNVLYNKINWKPNNDFIFSLMLTYEWIKKQLKLYYRSLAYYNPKSKKFNRFNFEQFSEF